MCDRPVILDRAALAARLGIHPDSVTREVHRSQIPRPAGRIGHLPYWYEDDLAAWEKTRPGRGAGAGRPRKETPA